MNTFTKNLLLTLSLCLVPLALRASESDSETESNKSKQAPRLSYLMPTPAEAQWIARGIQNRMLANVPSVSLTQREAFYLYTQFPRQVQEQQLLHAQSLVLIENDQRIKQELQAMEAPSTPKNKQPKTAPNTSPVKRKKEDRERE
jgi:hypothetical protein